MNEIDVRVRYAETDQMGRAHHAHHLVWCEAGRTAWLRERGVAYAELEERGVYLPVSRVAVDYRRPVRYDETVRVRTRLAAVESRRVTFQYTLLRRSDEAVLARAETDLVCVDRQGRIRSLPGELRELLRGGAGGAGEGDEAAGEDA